MAVCKLTVTRDADSTQRLATIGFKRWKYKVKAGRRVVAFNGGFLSRAAAKAAGRRICPRG